jgi:hypothetical protein
MDVNIVYECIGYGATRAVTCMRFEESSSQVPARFILDHASDPVDFCIEAYARRKPEQADAIDDEGRAMIRAHLEREAGFSRH